MSDSKYNGWANYATWRVHLEMFDGMNCEDVGCYPDDTLSDIMDLCRNFADDFIDSTTDNETARGWMRAFLSDVDWREIAQALKRS